MGKLLTSGIDTCDNSVIIGISFFYALLSIASLILGDVLMAKVDPRISFSGGGGRK
jgi:oligopeptide transport system permease protein